MYGRLERLRKVRTHSKSYYDARALDTDLAAPAAGIERAEPRSAKRSAFVQASCHKMTQPFRSAHDVANPTSFLAAAASRIEGDKSATGPCWLATAISSDGSCETATVTTVAKSGLAGTPAAFGGVAFDNAGNLFATGRYWVGRFDVLAG